jgi:hypothetical protein
MPAPAGMDAGTASQLIPGVVAYFGCGDDVDDVGIAGGITSAEARLGGVAWAGAESVPARKRMATKCWLRTLQPTVLRTHDQRRVSARLGQPKGMQGWPGMTKRGVAELSCQRNLATDERGERTAGRRTRG